PARLHDEQIRSMPKHLTDDALVERIVPGDARTHLESLLAKALRAMLEFLLPPLDTLADFLFNFEGSQALGLGHERAVGAAKQIELSTQCDCQAHDLVQHRRVHSVR